MRAQNVKYMNTLEAECIIPDNDLIEDGFGIGDVIRGRQRESSEVSLEEEMRLRVSRVHRMRIYRQWQLGSQIAVRG